MTGVEGKITSEHESCVDACSSSREVGFKEDEEGVNEMLFVWSTVCPEQNETERHDTVNLLSKLRGMIGWHVLAKERNELLDLT